MSNLDNLKKQAKQILRWHGEREWTVAEIIRLHLERYRGLSDRQVLDRPFRLADAQELVARREGFESWKALLVGLNGKDAATKKRTGTPRLKWAIPHIVVEDIKRATEWYGRVLGFKECWTYGEPPFFGQVARDGFKLALRCSDESLVDRRRSLQEDFLAADFGVDDVKALYLEYQSAGADFHQTLRTEPWGQRSFIIKEPDGNLICFTGPGD